MNRFQFVADHQTTFEVKRLCEVIEVARSSFYAWQAAAPARAERAATDAALVARIKVAPAPRQGGDRAYGAQRVTAELNDPTTALHDGARVNHKRVARVMREHRLAGVRLRAGSRPPSVNQPIRRSLSCSNVTSPSLQPTAATSVTSPTCPFVTAATCTWRP